MMTKLSWDVTRQQSLRKALHIVSDCTLTHAIVSAIRYYFWVENF